MTPHNVPRFGLVMEYVTDIPVARQFYIDVFGFTVERDHPTFVQLKSADGLSYAITTDAPMPHSTSPELWWVVDDIQAAFKAMSSQATVVMDVTQMPFGTCFGIQDPAGQVHYLLTFADQRPSQTVA